MKKWHKWLGLIFAFFMFMFALSGIFLNHRQAIATIDVPRSLLWDKYNYNNWNNGSVKGTFKLSSDSILLYGGNGIWLTDSLHSKFTLFTNGIKKGADNNIVNNIVSTTNGNIFSVTTFDVYKLEATSSKWIRLTEIIDSNERLSDIAVQGDSLVVMSRSEIFVATFPYKSFIKTEIPAPENYKKEASWFRTMWTLHSGELFGITGKLIVDIMGVFTILLSTTGIILTIWPKLIRRMKKKDQNAKKSRSFFKGSFKWHNKLGAWFFVVLLIIVTTGMFLRPPLLIAIVRAKSKPIPGTMLDSNNPWHDKLRCLRYDTFDKEWIFYSSDGFFKTKSLNIEPTKLKKSPPVSVMGVNVLNQQDSINWVVGSFSGIYRWNKQTGESFDFYTGKPYHFKRGGMPTFTNAVAGYSNDFTNKTIVFEYGPGAKTVEQNMEFALMPEAFKESRMSLWHLSLEVHVGRIYAFFPSILSDLFIFLSGVISLIILITGYILYRRHHKKRKKKKTLNTNLVTNKNL